MGKWGFSKLFEIGNSPKFLFSIFKNNIGGMLFIFYVLRTYDKGE